MQLRNFDLNLLTVFDAIFEERSIAGASVRLSLSESAISHALRRLRRALADELFVRSVDGMQPTQKAREFANSIRSALERISSALGGEPFEPQRAVRSFSLGASDYACTTLIPRLVESVASLAPAVDIHVVPANRVDLVRQLDAGTIDLAIGWFATVPERLGRAKLISEDYVFVVRPGHPLAAEVPTVQRILEFSHVAVNYLGTNEGVLDGYLPERGVLRRVHMEVAALEAPQRLGKEARIAVCVPHFWCLPAILLRCDMVASVPRRLALEFVERFAVVMLEDPEGSHEVAVEAIWDRRQEAEPALKWLREQIGLAAARLRTDDRLRMAAPVKA